MGETGRSRRQSLAEVAAVFLRLGTTAFGGPAAHIAMLEDEVATRRRWVSRQRFLDLLGVTNLIPGPNSTEMAIHIGYDRAGWAGLLVAGTCFIVPATLITLAVAWAYVRFGSLPQAAHLLYGVRPVIVAVVLQALWGLGRTALRGRVLVALALLTGAAGFLGVNELALLFVAASGPLVPLLRRHAAAGAFLDGVNVGSFALLLVVAWQLARSSIVDLTTVGLAAISFALLVKFRLNSAWLVVGGALVGLALMWLRR
jgi:chromate transporter